MICICIRQLIVQSETIEILHGATSRIIFEWIREMCVIHIYRKFTIPMYMVGYGLIINTNLTVHILISFLHIPFSYCCFTRTMLWFLAYIQFRQKEKRAIHISTTCLITHTKHTNTDRSIRAFDFHFSILHAVFEMETKQSDCAGSHK